MTNRILDWGWRIALAINIGLLALNTWLNDLWLAIFNGAVLAVLIWSRFILIRSRRRLAEAHADLARAFGIESNGNRHKETKKV